MWAHCFLRGGCYKKRAEKKILPLNKSPKEKSDGFLNVLSTQPAPLVLHEQTQDVQSNICHSCVYRTDRKSIIQALHLDCIPL